MIGEEFIAARQRAQNERTDTKAIGRAGMPLEVLLVEDSPGDVRLVQEAFRETKSSINLHVTIDGVDALAFLRQEGDYASSPRPDFILLDLNMPRMNGRELLTIIKRDQGLSSIPVAILTASDADIDIETSYALQANCYLRKPVDLLEFQTLIGVINQFWLTMVRFPPRPGIPKAFQGFDEASRVPVSGPAYPAGFASNREDQK
jgi:chemotaxis family two-component system response regulator Rcp1